MPTEFPYGLLTELSKIKAEKVNVKWFKDVIERIRTNDDAYIATCNALTEAVRVSTSLMRATAVKCVYIDNMNIQKVARKLHTSSESLNEYICKGLKDIRENKDVKFLLCGNSNN